MISSKTSPPAFQWDEWYGSIGGRQIHIKEVDTILQQIREHQYPRFTGTRCTNTNANFESIASAAETVLSNEHVSLAQMK